MAVLSPKLLATGFLSGTELYIQDEMTGDQLDMTITAAQHTALGLIGIGDVATDGTKRFQMVLHGTDELIVANPQTMEKYVVADVPAASFTDLGALGLETIVAPA